MSSLPELIAELAASDKRLEQLILKLVEDHEAQLAARDAEIERLKAGEDATPKDPGSWPTPGQLIYRWNGLDADNRLAQAASFIEAMQQADKCSRMQHAERLQEAVDRLDAKDTVLQIADAAAAAWRERAEQAEAEQDQLAYERRLLTAARMVLDQVAAADPWEDWDGVRQGAQDVAQRIVDEIGHSVTDEPALGPSFRQQIIECAERVAELEALADEHATNARDLGATITRVRELHAKWLRWPEDDMHHAAGLMLGRYLDQPEET